MEPREKYNNQLIDKLTLKLTDDIEKNHIIIDDYMADLLRSLGYSELVDFIELQERWYA